MEAEVVAAVLVAKVQGDGVALPVAVRGGGVGMHLWLEVRRQTNVAAGVLGPTPPPLTHKGARRVCTGIFVAVYRASPAPLLASVKGQLQLAQGLIEIAGWVGELL